LRKLPHQARKQLTRSAFSGTDVAAHTAIAFFDPPADGPLAGIVGAIQLLSLGSFAEAVAREAMPQVPAVEKQEAQAVGQTLVLTITRRTGLQIAPMQGFSFLALLPLPAPDQLALFVPGRHSPAEG
jgi:hypothetical protein